MLPQVMQMLQQSQEATQEMRPIQAMFKASPAATLVSRVLEVQQVVPTSILLEVQALSEPLISRARQVEPEPTNLQAHPTQECSKIQLSRAA